MVKEYLVGVRDVEELLPDGSISEVTSGISEKIKSLTQKEIVLRSKGLVVANPEGEIVYRVPKSHFQHFFPISIRDYAQLSYENVRFGKPFPIVSIDSHDVLGCDFKCQDCLSGAGVEMTKQSQDYNFRLPLDFYLHMLSEVASYSKRRGWESVRFEQSGEGNPDYYPHRAELIEQARKKFNMQSVYVSSGSKLDDRTLSSLVENASFIRISFPGVDKRSYALYSNQEEYTFEDSVRQLEKMTELREKFGREKELLLGVRSALRPEHDPFYHKFGKTVKDTGVDCLQLVKILTPDNVEESDFPVSKICKEQIEQLRTLSDNTFNITLPNSMDYLYYGRRIDDRSNFPSTCYSARVQPVLAGRGLFVCTKSEMMYSQQFKLGTFKGRSGELEEFLSEENMNQVAGDLPNSCETCCSILDNVILNEVKQVTLKENKDLSFYEVIQYD